MADPLTKMAIDMGAALTPDFLGWLRRAVAAEREACAAIADAIHENLGQPEGESARAAAEAIRARGL